MKKIQKRDKVQKKVIKNGILAANYIVEKQTVISYSKPTDKDTKMQKQNTNMTESKQTIFFGIDVHKKDWTVTFRTKHNGLNTVRFVPDAKKLVSYLERKHPNCNYSGVYEAGFSGFWLDRELRAGGVKNIVVNAADVPTRGSEKAQKTDKRDSRKLARELAAGNLEGIYIPSVEDEALRSVTRLRQQIVRDQTRVKNRIKSLLNLHNVEIPGNDEMQHWSANFMRYLSDIKGLPEEIKYTLDVYLANLTFIRTQLLQVVRKMRQSVKEDTVLHTKIKHLSSIPGIGFLTAMSIQTELIDINRFSGLDKLATFVGLCPAVYSSGDYSKNLGLTRRYKKYLRNKLIESAWVAVRYDPGLMQYFEGMLGRMSKQRAIIRVAKKLLSRIMYVMKSNVDYKQAPVDYQIQEQPKRKKLNIKKKNLR